MATEIRRICPVCGREYRDYPAISRKDNKTEICPDCGTYEALVDYLKYKYETYEALVDYLKYKYEKERK